MAWDRLRGPFAAEMDAEPPKYGLITNINTYNPFRIAFHEWAAMSRDLGRARSLREVLGYVLGPPRWRPDGTGPTAANIRAAWLHSATVEASTGGVDAASPTAR
jgi:hypothetical protein